MGADHEPALLDEIRARPDDDGPRLVFADALSERGDPWGELIVAGCELARLAREGVVDAERRRALQDRCRVIRHRRWRERSLTFDARLERGFCASVDIARDEVKQVEGYEFAALREVKLWVSSVGLTALAGWQSLRHVDRLLLRGVTGHRHYITDGEAAEQRSARTTALEQIAQRARLSSMELNDVDFDAGEVDQLTASALRKSMRRFVVVSSPREAADARWPALEQLGLVDLRLTGGDVERMLGRPELASLFALDMSRNAFGEAGMHAILDRALPHLRALRIGRTSQPTSGLTALARSSLAQRLHALSVGEERGGRAHRALCALAEAADQLVDLEIDQRSLTAHGAAEIAARLRAPLRKLQLRGGEEGFAMVAALVNNAALRGLRWLDLSGQPIGRAAVVALARAELPALEWLDLSDCQLDPESVPVLATSPTLPRRLALRLHGNALGPPSVIEPLLARYHDVRF